MNNSQRRIKQTFKDKDYRHGYVDEFLNAYIATQIKVLREQREWSQTELGIHAGGMKQPRISILENVNYSAWSITVLRKIAEAFDLTLYVSFESFGKRIEDIESFSRESLERNSFDKDPYFLQEGEKVTTMSDINQFKRVVPSGAGTSNNVVNIKDHIAISSVPENKILTQSSASAS